MKSYTIVSASDENQLITAVTQMIGQGWTPLGGVSVTSGTNPLDPYAGVDFSFFQAMVKPE